MFLVRVEIYICCSKTKNPILNPKLSCSHRQNHPDFHFHIFIDFSYFSCIFSTYWNLMLWYIKHIYFQKLLIYVKVRDTNLAICFFQTYGFLLWDSDGYIYLRGNKRRIISWRFISGMTTVKCKCTRRRIDFQNYFIKNQIWCFTIVEVTKNSEILSRILYGFAVNHADTMKIELDWRKILFTFSDLGHMACNTITITWYRNVTIWRLCCSFKTIISRSLHNEGNILWNWFLFHVFLHPIRSQCFKLSSVIGWKYRGEKQLMEWPICYSSPFLYPKLQTCYRTEDLS